MFSTFLVIASCGNILLQYVNSKNCAIRFGFGVNGLLMSMRFLVSIACTDIVLLGIYSGGGIMCMGGAMNDGVVLCIFVCFFCFFVFP